MEGFLTIFSNESDSDEEELVLLLEAILEPILDNLSIDINVIITVGEFKTMIPDGYSHLRELIDMSILSKLAVSIRDEYIAVALLENAIMLAYIYPGY
jgi:uncharacterized membrane protein YvlD (DUF360 family)